MNKGEISTEYYKTYANILKRAVVKAKQMANEKYICNSKNKSRATWNIIKQQTYGNEQSKISILQEIAGNSKKTLDAVNNFFVNQAHTLKNDTKTTQREQYEDLNIILNYDDNFFCLYKSQLNILLNIKKIKVVSETNRMIIRYFNEIFGWHLLAITVRSIVSLLGILDLYFLNGCDNEESEYEQICDGLFTMIMMYGTIVITLTCHSTTEEVKKLFSNCLHLKIIYSDNVNVHKELTSLLELLQNQPTFSAGGFFDIGRPSLLSVVSITTTYLIIIIQLNSGACIEN
ncbi:hypothetical protein HHI36_012600 [Cryptolaemus montrouzieri]|uniref:Gustatory receptor n=1 Tax=Cryptolaemus montrouzieri TaxID=559131 RepID=A0ABD2NFM0_9CUCU